MSIQELESKLLKHEKKTILLRELASLLKINPYETEPLYMAVKDLLENRLITVVKSSGTNGNISFPLHMKYKITVKDDYNDDETERKIKSLNPMLLRSGYLSTHPEAYVENTEIIEKLSKYFFSQSVEETISRKERSYKLFGREKLLDQKSVQSLLNKLAITNDDLHFYDTPEYCFHDYIPMRKDKMLLLICENKDIWFNLRRRMFEDKVMEFFGVRIDGVVYGNGNKVAQKQGALTEYVKFMGNLEVKFVYWGDIDLEGFEIFRRTKEANPLLEISLFIQGYRKMIESATHTYIEDSASSRLIKKDLSNILESFSKEEQIFLNDVLKKNKLIPQEIISYSELKRG